MTVGASIDAICWVLLELYTMASLARAAPPRQLLTKLAVLPYAVLTGTGTGSIVESDIVDGGMVIDTTINGDTLPTAGAAFLSSMVLTSSL